MKSGWFYALCFSALWIALKMLAFSLNWQLEQIQVFVLLNMALLTAAIALFLYSTKRNETEKHRNSADQNWEAMSRSA